MEKNDEWITKEYYKNLIVKMIKKINYINQNETISEDIVLYKLNKASVEYYIQLHNYFMIMYYSIANQFHHIYDDYLADFGKGSCYSNE